VSTSPATLPELLATVAARHGERDALISRRGGRITFAALAEAVADWADALTARGVGPGAHVGLQLPTWPEWLVLAFAVWRCGAVLVPIHTLYRPRALAHALDHADVSHLVAVRRFLRHDYESAIGAIDATSLRDVVWIDPPWDEVTAAGSLVEVALGTERAAVTATPRPDDVATIVFTSGSTAAPKGVVHTHAALCTAADEDAAVLGITPEDRTWGYLPFFFAGGLVAVALATLSRGAAVVLQDVFEPGETLALLERERVSVFFAWPHQAEALLAHPDFDRTRLHLTKGVGANTKWAAALYPPQHHAVGSFGMTETPPLCTAWPWDAPQERRASSHGPPVGAKELRITDPETGRVLLAGGTGEICVRGPSLMRGYHREDPAACFDADGFFHTGDLGWVGEHGELHFVGRARDVIKTAGANVAAAEVEAVLAEHPAVGAAYAVGVPDPQRGENVGVFVVSSQPVDEATLLAHCRARRASDMVPRQVWVRRGGELPQKGSGKVDKAALGAEAARLVGATGGAGRA
jgi:fatty-acyl-CoA synthase